MPKISVIVPVYNTEKYLKKCLDSILNQTYQDFEIIIINDGSTDGSEKIISEYKSKYSSKINYFKQENKGIAVARNNAIQKAIGEYFIFIDSDDYIEMELLERLNDSVSNKHVDIVKYKMKILDEKNITYVNGPIFDNKNGQDAFNELCFKDKMLDTPCLYLYNTKYFKENEFKFLENTYHEDFGLIPIILIMAKNVISIDYFGYNYIQVNNSIIRNEDYNKTVKKINDMFLHYDNMVDYIKNKNLNETTINNLKQFFSNSILRNYKKLSNEDQKAYKLQIKKRNLIQNMKIRNLKQLIKVIMFKIGIDIY